MQVITGELFDAVMGTNGGLMHLTQFLWDKYCEYLQTEIDARVEKKLPTVPLDAAKKRASAVHFVQWAADYLAEHRPAETFFLDHNLGLRLTTGETLALSPGIDVRGTMQDAGDVAIMEGKSQQDGVTTHSSVRI